MKFFCANFKIYRIDYLGGLGIRKDQKIILFGGELDFEASNKMKIDRFNLEKSCEFKRNPQLKLLILIQKKFCFVKNERKFIFYFGSESLIFDNSD